MSQCIRCAAKAQGIDPGDALFAGQRGKRREQPQCTHLGRPVFMFGSRQNGQWRTIAGNCRFDEDRVCAVTGRSCPSATADGGVLYAFAQKDVCAGVNRKYGPEGCRVLGMDRSCTNGAGACAEDVSSGPAPVLRFAEYPHLSDLFIFCYCPPASMPAVRACDCLVTDAVPMLVILRHKTRFIGRVSLFGRAHLQWSRSGSRSRMREVFHTSRTLWAIWNR